MMKNLVLLHGWGATGSIWRHQVENFSRLGFTVLTPTLPVWEASWLAGYFKELPLAETVLVGWSLGGMLLLEALSRGPFTPAGMVLVATPASFCQRPDHPFGQPLAALRALRRAVREDSRRALTDFASRCLAPGEANFQEELLREFFPQQNGAGLVAGLNYLRKTDLRFQLSKIQKGALIIQGDQDAIVPPVQTEVLRQYLKNSQVVEFFGAGHVPHITQAEAFNEILRDFLREGARERSPLLPPSNSLPQPLT